MSITSPAISFDHRDTQHSHSMATHYQLCQRSYDMLTANETERAKQRDSATQIESLHSNVDEKESKIAEYSKDLEALQQEMANLKSTCSLEITKVSKSAEDISTLQANLKEKNKMVDQTKKAGSKIKSMLSSQQKKNEELRTANASMSKELQAVRARIQKLEVFPVQSSDIDDDFV
jgi:chromosome segregation ATPase